jgi:DNA invertase Pin-like site-specific DNA recombinase
MTEPTKPIRVALYARISKDKSSQDTENQLADLRAFVEHKAGDGWLLEEQYVDRCTGKTAERPAFKRLFESAAQRKFDLILFWSLDRFSREGVFETLQHLQRLNSYGVDWWSFREEYLRSVGVFKEAVLAILAAVAKQERIRISERVHAGLRRARKEGRQLGRPRVVVDGARIAKLRERGLGIREIASETGLSHGVVARSLKRVSQTDSSSYTTNRDTSVGRRRGAEVHAPDLPPAPLPCSQNGSKLRIESDQPKAPSGVRA